MKLFDPRAALAEIQKRHRPPANPANSTNQVPRLAEIAELAATQPETQKATSEPSNKFPDDLRYGFALNGFPKTWAGKIVSLEEWKQLSAWEKHGPDGRMWNGKTRRWETPNYVRSKCLRQ